MSPLASPTTVSAAIDQLHEEATTVTGLDDFGSDDYLDGLEVLLEGYRSEAALTGPGWAKISGNLGQALRSRLCAEAQWRETDGHGRTRPLLRPIFVTGLPRSGTTALHRLLCADPRHQGLEMWLAGAPKPRPPRESWASDDAYLETSAHVARRVAAVDGMQGMHYLAPEAVEECWWLERQSMRSLAFPSGAHLPTYREWLAEQDLTVTYRRHRRLLEMIGSNDQDRRWVLKNPGHLFSLAALTAVYPDALVVTTHRDPRRVIASVSSLTARTSAGTSTAFTGATIGRDHLDLWSASTERYLADRDHADERRFVDVRYESFVADPVGTVAGIYAAFDLDFDDDARASVRAADDVSHRGERRPDHQYSLAEFGLSDAEVTERFAPYLARYGATG
ncbi:sulfotransferase family protein [Nocardioides sambongensis]|uniref:sulfotransferase family protein n=1 Tax=Nocardioides sambongensis TaxID=2589074 RepID=UPI001126152E|nr:sulfotransferase [Nocardioides sambongensis]